MIIMIMTISVRPLAEDPDLLRSLVRRAPAVRVKSQFVFFALQSGGVNSVARKKDVCAGH